MRFFKSHESKEKETLAFLSEREADNLAERVLRCPVCGFKIGAAYSDSTGHIRTKCQKCKHVWVLNLAYFRRQRRRYQKGNCKSE